MLPGGAVNPRSGRTLAWLFVAAAALVPRPARAVNLVPNPSFESNTGCPTSYSQMYLAAPWDAPTTGTSDYHNSCTSGPFSPDVPANPLGFQAVRTGQAYPGLIPLSAAV